MKKRSLLIIILFTIVIKTQGQVHPHLNENTTYYVSNSNGNDNNNGLSPYTPWKTTRNIEYWKDDINLQGTKILFKRGDVWNDTGLILKNIHGAENNPLFIGDYGFGDKPIISGKSRIINTFNQLLGADSNPIQNLWYCEMKRNPGRIFENTTELMRGYDVQFLSTKISSSIYSYNSNKYALGEENYSLVDECDNEMSGINKYIWIPKEDDFWINNNLQKQTFIISNKNSISNDTDYILIMYSTSNPNVNNYYKSINSGGWKSYYNIQLLQCSNILIKNIDFQGGFNCFAIGKMSNNVPISNNLSKNIEIMDCNIGKYSGNAFEIRNVENINIHDNVIDSGSNILVGLTKTNCKGTLYHIGTVNNISYWYQDSDRGTGDAIELSCYSINCKIYNNEFLNWGHSAVQLGTWKYTLPHELSAWEVSGNKVFNNTINSPLISYSRAFSLFGNHVLNNEFYNNKITNMTIQSQISGINNSFHHNIFDGVNQSNLRPKGYASAIRVTSVQPGMVCNNNKFDNNTFLNCEDGGIKITCSNNVVDGDENEYTYLPIEDNYFRNNIFYNCGTDSAALVIQTMTHNTYYNSNNINSNVHNNYYYNNLVFNDDSTANDVLYYYNAFSISNFNGQNGINTHQDTIKDNINSNPNFIDLSSSYKLANSPCKNAGDVSVILDNIGNILSDFNRFDYFNVSFPNEAPDIGAQEINPTVTRILKKDCDRVLTVDDTIVSFYDIPDNTEGYTVKLEDSSHHYLEFFISDTSFDISNYYQTELSDGTFLEPHTWYIINIKKGGISSNNYSNYGGLCNIRTPRFTFLTNTNCDSNIILQVGDYLHCYPYPNATEYIFEVTNSYGVSRSLINSTTSVQIPNTSFFRTGGIFYVKVRDINAEYGDSCIIKLKRPNKPHPIIVNPKFIKSISSTEFFYPNPCGDYINIKSFNKEINIQIFDILGKQYFNEIISKNQNRIKVDFLSKGVYVVIIRKDDKVFYEKIIKK